jgi:hypothetical protein
LPRWLAVAFERKDQQAIGEAAFEIARAQCLEEHLWCRRADYRGRWPVDAFAVFVCLGCGGYCGPGVVAFLKQTDDRCDPYSAVAAIADFLQLVTEFINEADN